VVFRARSQARGGLGGLRLSIGLDLWVTGRGLQSLRQSVSRAALGFFAVVHSVDVNVSLDLWVKLGVPHAQARALARVYFSRARRKIARVSGRARDYFLHARVENAPIFARIFRISELFSNYFRNFPGIFCRIIFRFNPLIAGEIFFPDHLPVATHFRPLFFDFFAL
jgi:hypothetical protein